MFGYRILKQKQMKPAAVYINAGVFRVSSTVVHISQHFHWTERQRVTIVS
jgi:hypothetical protein